MYNDNLVMQFYERVIWLKYKVLREDDEQKHGQR